MAKPKPTPQPLIPSRLELVVVARDERREEPKPIPMLSCSMRTDSLSFEISGPAHDSRVESMLDELKFAVRAIAENNRTQKQLAEDQRVILRAKLKPEGKEG